MTEKEKHQLDAFIALLESNDREGAVAFALGLLERGDVTIPELYEEILAPSLNPQESRVKSQELGIRNAL